MGGVARVYRMGAPVLSFRSTLQCQCRAGFGASYTALDSEACTSPAVVAWHILVNKNVR